MINNILRAIGVILFIIILIMDDFPFYKNMKNPLIQLVLAIILVLILLYDPILGFILSMVIMLIYYEIYKKLKNTNKLYNNKYEDVNYNPDKSCKNNKEILNSTLKKYDYVTEEHLIKAQNNIIDKNEYNKEHKYYNNKKEYGAQGLNIENNLKGYERDEISSNYK
tara:strand:- start:2803 stop:3300 length:498 start_codon:yes stop_codon:yes gene_type:complete